MLASIRRNLHVVLVAMVTAAVTASAPALAHGVQHGLFAHEADKVDGKNAVASGASLNQRKGKLVATNPNNGRLPNNIIARALNSNLIDGLDSTQLIRVGQSAGGDLAGTYPNPEIGPNAVGTNQLTSESVTNSKLAEDAVRGSNIANRAIGANELSFFNIPQQSVSVSPNGGVATVTATCPAGYRVISGGASFPFASGDFSASIEDPDAVGWLARGQNNGTQAQDLTVQAICLVNFTE